MKTTKWTRIRDLGSCGCELVEMRRVGDRAFQFITITDMHDATGETYGARFVAEVRYVDLHALTAKQIQDAVDSWGGNEMLPESLTLEQRAAGTAEMCMDYGYAAILWTGESNGWTRLLREARREARALLDEYALEAAMDRPVNAIGSTAREYMKGDLTSAMQRGCEAGDKTARLVAKISGAPQEVIDDTRPADWMPYLVGYTDGVHGNPAESDWPRVCPTCGHVHESERYAKSSAAGFFCTWCSERGPLAPRLAPEYHRGHERGVRVRNGEAPAPSWIRQSTVSVRPHDPNVMTNLFVDLVNKAEKP